MSRFVFVPFDDVILAVRDAQVKRFSEIEAPVLAAIGHFDRLRVTGEVGRGDYQTKARFFNELIASLIDACVGGGQAVAVRGKRPGVLLPQVDVDICFPSDPRARPLLIAETKIMGRPAIRTMSGRRGGWGVPAPPTSTSGCGRSS